MQNRPWSRADIVAQLRERIWQYVSPAAVREHDLCAAALLQMDELDVAQLARQQFLLTDELGGLLEAIPQLVRQLPTRSEPEEEWSHDRIRGAVNWQRTMLVRHGTGDRTLTISEPTQRDFVTPENQLLVFLLDQTVQLAQHLGWKATRTGAGQTIEQRVGEATRWRSARMLASIPPQAPTPRALARIRNGRHRRRLAVVLDAYRRYQLLIAHPDREALRDAIETHGFATRDDPTLFELLCWFDTLDALQSLGWNLEPHRLIEGSIHIKATRGEEHIDAWYQHAPKQLILANRYANILTAHNIARSGLIPDIVLRHQRTTEQSRWLVVEAKMGTRRHVAGSARAALRDLFAYENIYQHALADQEGPVALGIAWGKLLEPSAQTIMLCTPDCVDNAIGLFLA